MNEWQAFCRIDCRSCELYILTLNNDLDGKKLLAEKWGEKYKTALSIKDMSCNGCKSNIIFKMCESCDIKKCCKTRNIESCAECNDYQCERISKFYLYQEQNKTNVKFL